VKHRVKLFLVVNCWCNPDRKLLICFCVKTPGPIGTPLGIQDQTFVNSRHLGYDSDVCQILPQFTNDRVSDVPSDICVHRTGSLAKGEVVGVIL
jgi:hypothetical protein